MRVKRAIPRLNQFLVFPTNITLFTFFCVIFSSGSPRKTLFRVTHNWGIPDEIALFPQIRVGKHVSRIQNVLLAVLNITRFSN